MANALALLPIESGESARRQVSPIVAFWVKLVKVQSVTKANTFFANPNIHVRLVLTSILQR